MKKCYPSYCLTIQPYQQKGFVSHHQQLTLHCFYELDFFLNTLLPWPCHDHANKMSFERWQLTQTLQSCFHSSRWLLLFSGCDIPKGNSLQFVNICVPFFSPHTSGPEHRMNQMVYYACCVLRGKLSPV